MPDFAFDVRSGPDNESDQSLAFTVTDNSNPSLFSTVPALDDTGTLTYTAVAGAVGIAAIEVELSDDGGTANGGEDTSAPQTFTIEVVDALLPEVLAVAAMPGGPIEACSELRSSTEQFTVTFSETMADPVATPIPKT